MSLQAKYPGDGLDQGVAPIRTPTPALRRVLARMPSALRDEFTPAQLAALDRALDANNPTHHSINLRLTLFGLAYLVLLAGPERRNRTRRRLEREKHPLSTPGNIAVLTLLCILGVTSGYALRLLITGG